MAVNAARCGWTVRHIRHNHLLIGCAQRGARTGSGEGISVSTADKAQKAERTPLTPVGETIVSEGDFFSVVIKTVSQQTLDAFVDHFGDLGPVHGIQMDTSDTLRNKIDDLTDGIADARLEKPVGIVLVTGDHT